MGSRGLLHKTSLKPCLRLKPQNGNLAVTQLFYEVAVSYSLSVVHQARDRVTSNFDRLQTSCHGGREGIGVRLKVWRERASQIWLQREPRQVFSLISIAEQIHSAFKPIPPSLSLLQAPPPPFHLHQATTAHNPLRARTHTEHLYTFSSPATTKQSLRLLNHMVRSFDSSQRRTWPLWSLRTSVHKN